MHVVLLLKTIEIICFAPQRWTSWKSTSLSFLVVS